jgi:hypothetical protein
MENTKHCYKREIPRRPLLVKWVIRKEIDKGKKHSDEEEMVRALQGAFCKGRYLSACVSKKSKKLKKAE